MAGVHFKVTGDANGYIAATRQAEAATKGMVNRVTGEAKKIDDVFKTLATGAGTLFTVQMATQFSKQIAQVRGEFQQLEVAFETMLQSKEKADALMAQVVDTAAKTPFDLQGVANGAKQLLAYGVASEEVNDTLIRLGDIAAGLSIPLNDLVYLYGTTMTQGRLFTQDLRQFQGRGIPLADELAKQFGVAKGAVGELVTAGKVGFPEVQKAIIAMTSEGGKFNNLMAKQSQTITGQISNLEDSISQMFNEIGKASEGAISGAIGLASSLVENYEKVGRLIGGIVATFGTYKASIIALNAVDKARTSILTAQAVAQRATALSAKQVTAATVLWTKAQKALNTSMLTNPYVLAAAAVAALGVGIYALVTAKSKEEKAFERVNGQLESYQENLEKQKHHLQELFNTMNDSNLTEIQRTLAMEQLRELYPTILKDLSDEELLKLSVAEATKELVKQEEALYRSGLIKQIADKTAEYEKQLTILKTGGYGGLLGAASSKKQERDVEALRYEFELLLRQYNDLGTAAKKADFLALPADQKIISLKESNAQLDTEIAELVKKLKELHDRKNQAAAEQPQEFRLGSLSGALYDGGMTEDQILAEIKARQQQKVLNDKDIAENQAKVDANNKVLSNKQKKAKYDRQKAEDKAAKDLIKMKRDLNNRVAQADIDSMEDGYAKTIRQLEHNLELENQAIKQQKEDLLKRKENDALQSWLAEDPENRKAYDFKYTATFTQDEEQMWEDMGRLAQEAFDRGYEEAGEKWEKEAGLFIRQVEIDSMSDGYSKEAAQRQLDNEKELHSLELRRDAYIEAAKAAHLLSGKKEEDFDVAKAERDFDDIVRKTQARQTKGEALAAKQAYDEMLGEFKTYEQQRLDIEEKYSEAREKLYKKDEQGNILKDESGNPLLKEGVSQGNLDEINRAEQEEKSALDEYFAAREATFQVWANNVANLSLDQLKRLLEQAEAEMSAMEVQDKNAPGLAESRAKVSTLKKKIEDKEAQDKVAPGKRTIEEWKDLQDALSDCVSSFDEIGEAVGGVAGEILSTAGSIAGQTLGMINGIVQLVNISTTGMTTTGQTAASAIGMVEKASVILAVISAALQIVMAIINAVKGLADRDNEKEIERLVAANERLDKSYEKLERSIDKAYSVDASKLIEQQNTLLEQKKANLRLMIAEEKAKKNSDEEQIKQWEDEINGIETDIEDNAEKAKEAINGISFDGFRSNFLDALLDMEEGAEGLADTIEEDIRKAMYEALLTNDAFENQLRGLYDDLAAAIEAGDTREIDRIKAAILNLYDSQEQKAREIDEKIGYEPESTRSASEKGIAQASQSSVDELNGRMTAMQSHTFSINERVGNIVNLTSQLLARVISIEGHTTRLEAIEIALTYMRSDISDILTKGLRIKG